jgi:hypothetical protein
MPDETYQDLGVLVPEIMLPREGTDMEKWAVVACDQYTSQPEYWDKVEALVGAAPSTLRITLPEIFLESPDKAERIKKIHATMSEYIADQIFSSKKGAVLTERTINGAVRSGLIVALDLEQYDFSVGSQSLIRATEGTILDRIPPRVEIRNGAPLESPHIMVLIDDPQMSVIEPLAAAKSATPLYDFDLMMNGGHVAGWSVPQELFATSMNALHVIADPMTFKARYGAGDDKGVLLFAMGDGNHSLATAKTVWEMNKAKLPVNHPLRYALVELVNVHSPALVFEPIHRVLFGLAGDITAGAKAFYPSLEVVQVADRNAMEQAVKMEDSAQKCGFVNSDGYFVWTFTQPTSQLTVGTLQPFLDTLVKGGTAKIDYIHGAEEVCTMGAQAGNCGFFLPGMNKNELFKTVIFDGALPRKTFSMGEANEKRYYLECRSIS